MKTAAECAAMAHYGMVPWEKKAILECLGVRSLASQNVMVRACHAWDMGAWFR